MIMRDKYKQKGFTLVELAIVLVIVGVLLGGFITTLASRIESTQRSDTQEQLEDIKLAILGFAATYGRIPCPAVANPAIATEAGLEQPDGGGTCDSAHGFVPGRTLGLNGSYNRDNLLVDTWGNPIRYSVTNDSDFTTAGGIAATGMGGVGPDLIVCNGDSANTASCSAGLTTLVGNAPFVILSLGKDGNEFVGRFTADNANADTDQGENSAEIDVAPNAVGENLAYSVGNNRVFVSKSYVGVGATADQFDDIIVWVSPYILYSRMIEAEQLP
ncbi:MAG: type II secretion system GspH family protein [Gammaproteobacteria bacterium]|nr:type II secretion system GspH family protein [Gammaproteobacteria bacterium]